MIQGARRAGPLLDWRLGETYLCKNARSYDPGDRMSRALWHSGGSFGP